MTSWPDQPVILEINTWVWLEELRRTAGSQLDLGSVPAAVWDATVPEGVDAVWLMGVWERSPAGTAIALEHPGLRADVEAALPDATDADIVGSPYCIRRYTVDEALGGDTGLAAARGALARRGIRLLVDYVPNHVARDHPWVTEHPSYLVHGTPQDLAGDPESFAEIGGEVVALGRDPYFPAWTDVVQLNAFDPGLRAATASELRHIAERADGVRCDMAMLLLNEVFARTWGDRVGPPPAEDFWPGIIASVRAAHPDFLFASEAYWDLQAVLLEQGFDYCYDKHLADILVRLDPAALREHLRADLGYQRQLVRFLENHDEPRAASVILPEALEATAVAVATLPGALLLYEGQLEGRRTRPPVQLGRRPTEPLDGQLRQFWDRLLVSVADARQGDWTLVDVEGWADNPSWEALVAWRRVLGGVTTVVVLNLGEQPAQGRIRDVLAPAVSSAVTLVDPLSGARYERDGDDLATDGLYVELAGWGYHMLRTTN